MTNGQAASAGRTNGASLSVSHFVPDPCVNAVISMVARRNQGSAVFGPVEGYGPAGRQEAEVVSDAQLIAKTEFTPKLAPFAGRTGARCVQDSDPVTSGIWNGASRKSVGL